MDYKQKLLIGMLFYCFSIECATAQVISNISCIEVTFYDNFGDGWDIDISGHVISNIGTDNDVTLLSTITNCSMPYIRHCVQPLALSDQILFIFIDFNDTKDDYPSNYWEILWSLKFINNDDISQTYW